MSGEQDGMREESQSNSHRDSNSHSRPHTHSHFHEHSSSSGKHRRHRKHSRSREPLAFRDRWEQAGGALLLALIVATPWLFGTTEPWSMRLMNIGSVIAVVSILQKRLFTRTEGRASGPARCLAAGFLAVNLALLAFCAISFFNARASFSLKEGTFRYLDNVIRWLPSSYDKGRTGVFLQNTCAFFLIFWSARAWLMNGWRAPINGNGEGAARNRRLKWFLWVVCLNGFAVAVEGIFQRLTGTTKLLWIRQSWWASADSCFGPFSYRGNGADYLNLVWPLIFGLWYLVSRQKVKPGKILSDGPELLLLPMFLMTAAAAFISLSRGGALTAAALMLMLAGIVLARGKSKGARWGFLAGFLAIITIVISISEGQLSERFKTIFSDHLSGRPEIYANARQIAADFPLFGSGPGTFESVYFLYRQTAAQEWHAFVHDDWLETRATFGWVGFGLVLIQFALLFGWAWVQRKRWISEILGFTFLLSLAGCMFHAKVDLPFQTYAILFTFVAIAAAFVSLAPPLRAQDGILRSYGDSEASENPRMQNGESQRD